MIISINIETENTYYKIFEAVKIAFAKLNSKDRSTKGRPRKYSDQQIVACMLYGVKNSIFSLRELEYRIKQDYTFKAIIQLTEVPDYSTFSLRAKALEQHLYYGVYAMLVELISPETRLCAIDGTALRSSKYDSEAKSGKGTRLGYFIGYKLHCIAAVTDIIIPLVFNVTTPNVYDNQVSDLLYEAKIYNPFLILADAAYDSVKWLEIASDLKFNLLTDINMRKAKSLESFTDKRYENALFIQSPIGLKLYKNRLKIEQLFSTLKGLYNLENPRLYGQARYERHIKWVLLAYLVDEFNKKQQGIKSRKYPWNL
ncbi:transposase [Clostridium perfringens]|uniref:transposase n=1 Tax=Clostridium perfringens TaxID=1502 RepID=UPI0018E401F1|nr:transposase [Clostridium perfringens]MBI5977794.1 transposase [Clostridium perfringens]MBI5980725.1 transposase [Clostridium perfringens]MBI5990165.1 transposase [Clostridium perfringens]MBI5994888.1 transposase [Clostridium perfringens]MBI6003337.1 transposase [Clostridium perfringens]